MELMISGFGGLIYLPSSICEKPKPKPQNTTNAKDVIGLFK